MRQFVLLSIGILLFVSGCSEGTTSNGGPPTDATVDSSLTWDTSGTTFDGYVQSDYTVDMTWSDTNSPQLDAPLPQDMTVFQDLTPTADQAIGPPPANDLCTAAETLIWNGFPIIKQGNTATATDDVNLDSGDCTGDWTTAGDVFYQITLPTGDYSVTLTPGAGRDMALYVLSSCNPPVCVDGSDMIGADIPENVLLNPTASTTYIIGVDAYNPAQNGTFTLEIKVAVAPDGGFPDASLDAGPGPDATVTDGGPAPDGSTGPFSATCPGCDLSINDCTRQLGVNTCVPKSDTCTYTDGTLMRQCECTGWQFCLSGDVWSTDCEPSGGVFSCL